MRRSWLVLGSTTFGLAGLLAFNQVQFGTPFGTHARLAPGTKVKQAAATAPAGSLVATGDSFPNQYGSVQVRVAMENGTLVAVTAVDLPYGDPQSQQINDQAGPILAQQALDAQSANISGSTKRPREKPQRILRTTARLAP